MSDSISAIKMLGKARKGGFELRLNRRTRRSWIAFVAGCALVFQVLFGAVLIDARASSVQLDAFGNVICTSHGAETEPDGGDPSKQSHLPDCCNAGCCMSAHAVPVQAYTAGLFVPFAKHKDTILRAESERPAPSRKGTPSNPRAPPLAV